MIDPMTEAPEEVSELVLARFRATQANAASAVEDEAWKVAQIAALMSALNDDLPFKQAVEEAREILAEARRQCEAERSN